MKGGGAHLGAVQLGETKGRLRRSDLEGEASRGGGSHAQPRRPPRFCTAAATAAAKEGRLPAVAATATICRER